MILAVDPGLATCGWAIVRPRTGRVVDVGVLIQGKDQHLGKNADRVRRARRQAEVLYGLVDRYDCDTIAAEALSFPRRGRINAVASLCLSWGVICGLVEHVVEVPPKTWQRAIVPESGSSIDYDDVFARLSAFVEGMVAAKLLQISKSKRNHALDAVGVGLYAALCHVKPERRAAA